METFLPPRPIAAQVPLMEGTGAMALAILFIVLPWLVILVDALVFGFNFLLSLAMLLVFGIGLMFLAATAEATAA